MKQLFSVLFYLALAARLTAAETSPAPTKPALSLAPPGPGEPPVTTQIYADEASFDTEKRIGVFSGHVRVFDPRFNIQSDKLTVHIHKEESQGLERAIAEGHVGVVRAKADPKRGPNSQAVGLSEKAVYTSADGNVELTGSPRVQQGLDTHIATSPQTVMILNQNGQLTTHGPSRTEIRQQAKDKNGQGAATPAPTAAKPKP